MDRQLERLTEKIKTSRNPNKESILKFVNFCFAQGLSERRIVKYLYALLKISSLLGRKFEQATRDNIIDVIAKLEKQDYEQSSLKDFKVCLKKFYSWLKDCEPKQYPKEVSWIRTSMKKNNEKIREILDEQEIEKMISVSNSLRDKALLTVLWESGSRSHELLGLLKQHVTFDEYSAIIVMHGKTGVRRVRIIDKHSYFKNWIESLPNEPTQPVWTTKFNRMNGNQVSVLDNAGLNKLLKVLGKKSGIQKRIFPHLFRSSRATFLANHLTEQQLKKIFGWTQGSQMLNVYINQGHIAVDEEILKLNGLIESKEQEIQSKLVINALGKLLEKDPKILDLLVQKMKTHGILKEKID